MDSQCWIRWLTKTKNLYIRSNDWNWSKLSISTKNDYNWFKTTEVDWNWPKTTEVDRNWLKTIKVDRNWPKTTEVDSNWLKMIKTIKLNENDTDWPFRQNWQSLQYQKSTWSTKSIIYQITTQTNCFNSFYRWSSWCLSNCLFFPINKCYSFVLLYQEFNKRSWKAQTFSWKPVIIILRVFFLLHHFMCQQFLAWSMKLAESLT